MALIIGVDPGKTTGICSFVVEDNEISCIDYYELNIFGVGHYFTSFPYSFSLATVVVEQYRYNPKKPANWSLEVIGLVRYFAQKLDSDLRFRTPAQSKALVSNDILKRAGLYFPGKGHACDAARLGLHYTFTDLKQLHFLLKEEENASS